MARYTPHKERRPGSAVVENWGPPRDSWAVIVGGFMANVQVAILPHPCLGTPCWFWKGARGDDYGDFQLAGTKVAKASRASWIIHHGPIPFRQWVLHKCDVKQCVNPDHLFLGRCVDNTRDYGAKLTSGRMRLAREYAASHFSSLFATL